MFNCFVCREVSETFYLRTFDLVNACLFPNNRVPQNFKHIPNTANENIQNIIGEDYSLIYPITLWGRWGTTDDDLTAVPFHLVLSSAALVELTKSSAVHSRILPPTSFSVGDGRVVRRSWVNFQCRGVLLIWIIVGQGPIALAIGAGGGLLGHFFSHLSLLFSFSLSGRRPDID